MACDVIGQPARIMIRRTVLFSGRVQGVGFRYATCRVALPFAVTGWVRNLPDGRVEACVEGNEEEIRRFVQAIKDRMKGYICDTQASDADATGEFADFDVRY